MKFQTYKANILDKLKINPPTAMTMPEWKNWHEQTKKEKPLAYFLKYNVLEKIENFISSIGREYRNFIYFFKYRTTHRYNILHTGLKPNYYDLDTRMMHGLFNELVNFVEVDKALMNNIWGQKKFEKKPFFGRPRSKELGLDYLEWETKLEESGGQAENAKEVIALYKWWTEVYKNRPDPNEASGWSGYCERNSIEEIMDGNTKEDSQIYLDKLREIEVQYEKEDEEMLIRLIKIRKQLWT